MYEFLHMFDELGFADAIAEYVGGVARYIAVGFEGVNTYRIEDEQVGFIVALVATLMWVFLSIVACYLFVKAILFVIRGLLNW